MSRQITFRDETLEVWEQTRRHIFENARLREENAFLRGEFEKVLMSVRANWRARCLSILKKRRAGARVVRFPAKTFNLHELQQVNPELDSSVVQVELAKAIRSGQVEFAMRSYPGFKDMVYCARVSSWQITGELPPQ